MSDRIKLAEAMGWKKHPSEDWWQSPKQSVFKPVEYLPDPFTDANDDYAVLGWMRNMDEETIVFSRLQLKQGLFSYFFTYFLQIYSKIA